MIRLPQTSISLSKADIEQHLHDISIYQGLLKQGFEKRDVLQYFRHQERQLGGDELLDLVDTVSLARRRFDSAGSSYEPTYQSVLGRGNCSLSLDSSVSQTHRPSQNATTADEEPGPEPATRRSIIDTASPSPSSVHDVDSDTDTTSQPQVREVPQRYAPRQSSLLRFTNLVSSDDSTDAELLCLSPIDAQPSTVAHQSYSETDVYQSQTDRASRSVSEQLKMLVIDDKEESDDSTSIEHHNLDYSNFSSVLLRRSNSPLSRRSDCPHLPKTMDLNIGNTLHPVSSPDLQGHWPSLGETDNFPSSPPFSSAFEHWHGLSDASPLKNEHSSSAMLQEPDTDSDEDSNGGAHTDTMTVNDRMPARQYTDQIERNRTTFAVYNDALPASTQPQTPADFHSSRFLDSSNISYTAPPGMVRYGSQIQEHAGVLHHDNFHTPSPTIRAMDLRTRRNREFRRSATVESLRLNRTRRIGRNTDGGDAADQAHHEHSNIWRDDLDADRVGEENFDRDSSVSRVLGSDFERMIGGNQADLSE